MIVSPGFIDVHTHDDENVFKDPSLSSKVSQGVTTCIAGNCGISLAPFSYKGDVPDPIALLGKSEVFRFPRVKDYKDEFESKPSSVNIALLTGHSMLRVEAMNGEFDRPANSKEIKAMIVALETALEDGSIGLSTGLAYPAANASPTSEIIELAKVLPKFNGVFTTHMRNEGVDVVKSVQETIAITNDAKVRTVISHHKCAASYHKIAVSYRKGAVSYYTCAVSYRMYAVSYHKGAVSHRKGTVSYHTCAIFCHTGAVSYHTCAVSYRKGAVSYHMCAVSYRIGAVSYHTCTVLYHKGAVSYHTCTVPYR